MLATGVEITLYQALLFAHLTFVSIWVGGDFMLQAVYLRAKAAGAERTLEFLSDVEWIGQRVLIPAALGVVLFGVWLVLDSPAWDFGQFWVTAGLAVFLASALTGSLFLGPESGRVARLGEERGAEDPDVQRRIGRALLVSKIELVLLILVIFDMTIKPFL